MPTTIDEYEIKYELGSGGFGTVYAALDVELGRWVAIKQLRPEVSANPALVERFRAEAISLARLNHPNITTLHRLLRRGDEWFLVMELVQGQTLETVLHRVRRLGVTETLAVVAQTAAGLGYANRMGVIHRDIKPSNLMLTDSGQVKIMDFGIARIRGTQRLTRSGLLGTYAYLAPEQFRGGEGTEQSDMYALACVVYEMLSGNIPFDAPTEAEMMRGHLELPARSLRDVIQGIEPRADAAIQRALAKDPAARFASVEEFSDALGAASVERQATEIVRTQILSRMPPPSRPTTLSDVTTGANRSVSSGGPSGAAAGQADKKARSGLSRRMPAIVLGLVAIVVIAGGGAILLPDMFSAPTESARPAVALEVKPPPVVAVQPVTPPVPPRQSIETISAGPPPAALADAKPLPPEEKTPQRPDLFIGNRSDSAEDLMKQAKTLIAGGQIGNAQTILRKAKDMNHGPALIELALLEDPTNPDRPASYPAHPSMAARYYKEAEDKHETSGHEGRERLRRYLQERANNNDYDAKATLQVYWP